MAALAPALAGLAVGEGGAAVGLGAGLTALASGAAGALTGGLIQHSPLGAIEGALGGVGGGFAAGPINAAVGGLGSALGFGGSAANAAAQEGLGAISGETGFATLPGGTAVSAFSPAATLGQIGSETGFATLPGGGSSAPSFFGSAGAAPSVFAPINAESGFATLPSATGAAPSFFAPAAGGSALGAGLGGLSPGAVANLARGVPGALGLQGGGAAPSGLGTPETTPTTTTGASQPQSYAPTTAGAAQPTTSAPAAVGSGGGSPTSSEGLLGNALGFLNKNAGLLQLALGAGGLGASALERPAIPGLGQNVTGGQLNPQSSLGQEVATNQQFAPVVPAAIQTSQGLTASAQPLINAPTTGQLPPGMQQMITQQLQDEVTAIKSKYASLGESGSTAETEDIGAAGERAQSATAQLLLQTQAAGLQQLSAANSATNEALNAAGLQNQVWSQIAGIQLSSDQQLQQAISNISSAAAGGVGRAA